MEPEKKPLEKEKHRTKPAIFGFHVSCRGCSPLFLLQSSVFLGPRKLPAETVWKPQGLGPLESRRKSRRKDVEGSRVASAANISTRWDPHEWPYK